MIVKIFTGPLNYDVSKLYSKDESEYVIVVDQACDLFEKSSVFLDLAIGDFDSTTIDINKKIMDCAHKVIVYPKHKDYTDTYLAVEEALKLNPDEIVIYGGIGGRTDHTLANIQLLQKGPIKMVNEETTMYVLEPGIHVIENKRKYISFFAVENVNQLTLDSFAYQMKDYNLKTEDPLCISNEGSGTVSFKSGKLLVIEQDE